MKNTLRLLVPFWKKKAEQNISARQLSEKVEQLGQRLEWLEREQLLALGVLGSMSEAVIAVDSSQKVLLVNSATERLFGIQQQKIKGKNFLEAIRNSPLNEIALKTLRENRPQLEEMEMLTPIARFFRVHTAPLAQQGRIAGVVMVLYDMTQLKQLEQVRKEFVANVSHELKTPLTSIQASVETLLDGAINDSRNNRKFLECIQQDAVRLGRLIEDLLQLSRIESKEVPLKKEEIALESFIQKAVEHFQKVLGEKKLSLTLKLETKSLTGDSEQLQRAVENLLDNAIKYNQEGGNIGILAKKEENWTRIEIEDTGVGIPQGDLPRIFERFYRVDKARSRELGGTGLGLSIVKHIAERHGGRVEVTSQLDKGSRFSLIIPA